MNATRMIAISPQVMPTTSAMSLEEDCERDLETEAVKVGSKVVL